MRVTGKFLKPKELWRKKSPGLVAGAFSLFFYCRELSGVSMSTVFEGEVVWFVGFARLGEG
jgi:hypothetical protein